MLCHITMLLLHIQNSCQARALSHFALFTVTLNHQKESRRKKHRARNPSQTGGGDSFNVIILASDMMVLWTILT